METATFRVKLRPKAKTQGQMLHDFSEAVIAKRESEKASYPEIPEGFIPHDGGPCPVAEGTLIWTLYRDGFKNEKPVPVMVYDWGKGRGAIHWRHIGSTSDIIAYKPERSPDFRVETSKFYLDEEGQRIQVFHADDLVFVGGNGVSYREDGKALDWCYSDLIALAADQTSPMVSE